jgi:hypothetical protein
MCISVQSFYEFLRCFLSIIKNSQTIFQTRRITENFTGPSRIVEIKALLEKEIQLLNGIEKRRIEIQKEIQEARQDRILKKYSETVKWIGYKSKSILNSQSHFRF